MLFSYQGDFNPVCTTEIIGFTREQKLFENLNTQILALSVDSKASHLAWIHDIYYNTGIKVDFPIIEDMNGELARKYGMISSDISATQSVRSTYIIDPSGFVQAILTYPMNLRKINKGNITNSSSTTSFRRK